MKKIKYYYNTHTLRYEKLITPLRVKLLRVFGFMAAAVVTAFIIVAIAFQYIDSPKEKILQKENDDLKENYVVLQERIGQLQKQMIELEARDNNVYRSIFEATPIPDSARLKEMEDKQEIATIEGMANNELVSSIILTLNNLGNRIKVQNSSYSEID